MTLPIALFVTALLLAQPVPPPQVNPSGSAPQTYREKRLGFLYTLPPGMELQPGAEDLLKEARRNATVPDDSLALECLTIPVRLKSPTSQPYERFVFFVTDFGCLGREYDPTHVPSFTQSSMTDLLKGYGSYADGRGAFYTIDNHDADWETLAVAADTIQPGLVLYGAQACIALEHSMACWNFITSDSTRLHVLSDINFTLDGHKAQRLSPTLRLKR